jgi:hypothetical protein
MPCPDCLQSNGWYDKGGRTTSLDVAENIANFKDLDSCIIDVNF